ncbi:dipeptide ABC transporter ATP-binding protein [Devosia lacusdianchii]|uniref:dipeptide ABC transporter ATP-binding protein n=1 Tax=Devosia lacusdianchii TaxID=2917991 RepID=UPI001F06F442|nr:ABC transporter ATP-binding protein [Devosia sp. JXJ CY 41]
MTQRIQSSHSVLDVTNLSVTVGRTGYNVVKDLSFSIGRGKMLALVGESGSGKTMAARSIIQVLPPGLAVVPGSRIRLDGRDLASISQRDLRRVRGAEIGMVFQEPMVSLNPSMTIGRQLAEGLRLHTKLSDVEITERCMAMLDRVQIANPARCMSAHPHEFSGGMRQRIMLASVMLLKPKLLIADEPTTALDTLVQHEVLRLMVELCEENDTAVLMISHDLGMVSHYVENIVVMQNGEAVETGASRHVLTTPQHPYTRKLVEALPRRSPARTLDRSGEPLVSVEGVCVDYGGSTGPFSRRQAKRAVQQCDLAIHRGETVALVGGSGSGKTSLGRAIVGLVSPSEGRVAYQGKPMVTAKQLPTRAQRLDFQLIFQDPYSSLDPRMSVERLVEEPLLLGDKLDRSARRERVIETCIAVGLDETFLRRLPHQLSGGQRQRVAIARAIVNRPVFIVADEPVSALDMTVQRQILILLADLQKQFGFACLFVSHDLGAVEQVADRVVVMHNGRIVEQGLRDDVFDRPQHDYTRSLLEASMLLDRQSEPSHIA